MPDKELTNADRLERIEESQKRLLAAAATTESRIDILHQEFQRAATAIHRLRLAHDNAQRRDEALDEIRRQLSRIEALLAER